MTDQEFRDALSDVFLRCRQVRRSIVLHVSDMTLAVKLVNGVDAATDRAMSLRPTLADRDRAINRVHELLDAVARRVDSAAADDLPDVLR